MVHLLFVLVIGLILSGLADCVSSTDDYFHHMNNHQQLPHFHDDVFLSTSQHSTPPVDTTTTAVTSAATMDTLPMTRSRPQKKHKYIPITEERRRATKFSSGSHTSSEESVDQQPRTSPSTTHSEVEVLYSISKREDSVLQSTSDYTPDAIDVISEDELGLNAHNTPEVHMNDCMTSIDESEFRIGLFDSLKKTMELIKFHNRNCIEKLRIKQKRRNDCK